MRKLAAILIVAVVASGCATQPRAYRPFTEHEKHLLAVGIVGHCADVITTEMALSSGAATEANPVVRTLIVDNEVEFMAIKASMIATTYIVAHGIEDTAWRRRILQTSIVAGWTPALWNIGIGVAF